MATAPLSPPRPRLRSLPRARPLSPRTGSIPVAAHAYHGTPTGARQTRAPHNGARPHVRSLLAPPTSSLPHAPARAPLSCETFRREPATRRLVWSFAAMPMSCQRVAHQHGSGPLPAFPRASAGTGIVRRLSGPTAATHRASTAPALPAFASPPRRAPWAVFQYGTEASAPPVLSLFIPHGAFQTSLAVLLRYRTRSVFSLGCSCHPFALRNQTALLLPRACPGLSPASAPHSRKGSPARATTRLRLPPGLLPVRSPLLRESTFVSPPALNDMLKSGAYPCANAHHSGRGHCQPPFAYMRARHRQAGQSVPYRSRSPLLPHRLNRPGLPTSKRAQVTHAAHRLTFLQFLPPRQTNHIFTVPIPTPPYPYSSRPSALP